MSQWGDQDPEAAAQWLSSLPNDAAAKPAAAGLAAAWAAYDEYAASDWAANLPAGPVRDGAAASLAKSFARGEPEEAWHWAASISNPMLRAEALDHVRNQWGSKAPDEFRAALTEARQAAGLPEEE